MIARINTDVENRKQAIIDGANRVKELARKTADSLSWELSWKKDEATGENKPAPGTEAKPGELPKAGIPDFDSLMKKMGKSSGQKSGKEVIDLNEAVTNNKGDTAYSAIASRLTMVKMPPAAVSPVQVIPPAPGTPVNNINVPGAAAPVVNVDNTDYTGKDKTEVLQGIAENVSGIRSILGGGLAVPASQEGRIFPDIPEPSPDPANQPETGRNKTVYLRGIYDSVIRLPGYCRCHCCCSNRGRNESGESGCHPCGHTDQHAGSPGCNEDRNPGFGRCSGIAPDRETAGQRNHHWE